MARLARAFTTRDGRPSVWDARAETQLRLAKWYAREHGEGAHGMHGGWIYTAGMKPITQGWGSYYDRRKRQIWQALEERAQ